MRRSYSRALRYVHSWMTGRNAVIEEEIRIDRADRFVPATVVLPRGARGPLPAWIVLHGITRLGRGHAQLRRFTKAAAATGAAVIVPEVPEWCDLDLSPTLTSPTVAGAIRALREHDVVGDGPYGLVGFSFGAPHAMNALAEADFEDSLSAAVGFGGYCDPLHTFRFLMTGHHEYGGESYYRRPDPYGRWIVGANYLATAPGYEDAEDVGDALRKLGILAGDTGPVAWDPCYDDAKAAARKAIGASRRELFDAFAGPSDQEPDLEAGTELAAAMLEGVREVEPTMDPLPTLGKIRKPVHVLHGRQDHLIAFTEALRLGDELRSTELHSIVTPLFGHSAQDPLPSPIQAVTAVPRFIDAVARIFGRTRGG